MNETAGALRRPAREDEWGRLAWIIPLAIVLWAAMLTAFGVLLGRTGAPPPLLAPVEARIVELPPEVGPKTLAPAAPVAPKPRVVSRKPPPVIRPLHHPRVVPAPASTNGIAKAPESPAAVTAPSASGAGTNESALPSGAGIGNDQGGARAIFAPKPEIPDDLRDEPFHAVAIARFTVGSDGTAEVTLAQPTENPRLNGVLLETLSQWRFAPAVKDGVAIASQFDVRIPIDVE